jgi:snurportin-1
VVSTSSPSVPSSLNAQRYHFPYPTTFLPVPYHADTSLAALNNHIIPSAKAWRLIDLHIPSSGAHSGAAVFSTGSTPAFREEDEGEMEIETGPSSNEPRILSQPQTTSQLPAISQAPVLAPTARVQPDGLLLYVAEASYEPGTSPLSSWVPISLDAVAHGEKGEVGQAIGSGERQQEGPLEIFQRCVFFSPTHYYHYYAYLIVGVGL